jgi:hypothetical protein
LKQILVLKTDSDLASRFVLEAGTLTKQSSPPTPSISSLRKGFDILGSDSTYGLDKGFDDINNDDPQKYLIKVEMNLVLDQCLALLM